MKHESTLEHAPQGECDLSPDFNVQSEPAGESGSATDAITNGKLNEDRLATNSKWTDDEKDRMVRLRENGPSMSEIAHRFDVTRNTIAGIFNRMKDRAPKAARPSGFASIHAEAAQKRIDIEAHIRAHPGCPRYDVANQFECSEWLVSQVAREIGIKIIGSGAPRKPRRPEWSDAPIPSDAPPPRMISLLDLEPNECKWPYGDPKEADFGFCAHERAPGSSYCRYHAARSSGSFHCEEQAA